MSVSYLPTTLDIPVERVLDSDTARECDRVMVIGWRGDDLYFASSTGDVADLNFLMDLAKASLIDSVRDQG